MEIILTMNGKSKKIEATSAEDLKNKTIEFVKESKEKIKKVKSRKHARFNDYGLHLHDKMSIEAIDKLTALDRSFIGTRDYMGFAYSHDYEYRHYLRDVPPFVRQKIHNEFLDNNLEVDGESDKHLAILKKHESLFKKINRLWQ